MTVNVRKMKPVEMVRFLNSTELGTVLSAATVYRHFADAGYRIASTEDSRCLSSAGGTRRRSSPSPPPARTPRTGTRPRRGSPTSRSPVATSASCRR